MNCRQIYRNCYQTEDVKHGDNETHHEQDKEQPTTLVMPSAAFPIKSSNDASDKLELWKT